MRIVDADLKLKADVRQIKESFYNLIKNFEAFEQRNPEYEIKAVLEQQPKRRHIRRQRTHESRKSINRYGRRHVSEMSSMRSSIASSVAQQCPNNTKISPDKEAWASLLGSNDTAELPSCEYSRGVASESVLSEQGVEDISSITRCSNVTYREQVSQSHIVDIPGPLSSTMRYPQYSTPEKQMRLSRIEDVDSIPKSSCTKKLNMDEPRSKPTGRDKVLDQAPNVVYNSTDTDATPVVVQRSRPVSERPAPNSGDSGLFTASTAATERSCHSSQHYFLSGSDRNSSNTDQATPVAKRMEADSDSMDSKLRRQTAQPCLSQELRSPVGLSETDLADPSSFFEQTVTDIQCSMNATRASVANISSLSVSPTNSEGSDGVAPSTDVTMSTGVESSYKESDGTNTSSPPFPPKSNSRRSRSTKRLQSRQLQSMRVRASSGRALSQCTSATSTSSYGGMVAPTNSPNLTKDSAAVKIQVNMKPDMDIEIETIGLGSRPPCIGSDDDCLPPLPQVTRALSDPEGMAKSLRMSRYARTAEQVSGASSTPSDKSLSPVDSYKGNSSKEERSSPQEAAYVSKKSVRRSFSKKIMNLGKQLLRGNSTKSKSTDEQHSV